MYKINYNLDSYYIKEITPAIKNHVSHFQHSKLFEFVLDADLKFFTSHFRYYICAHGVLLVWSMFSEM